MHDRRKRFLSYLKKPKEKRKREFFGDIRWSLDFWLSQLSFWHVTVKSFYNVWHKVTYENYEIPFSVRWEEGIVLYVIFDFISCFKNGGEKCVKKSYLKKYEQYLAIERG